MATTITAGERTNSESLVDRDSHFDGLYKTEQNLRVEGQAEGEIHCRGTLIVEQGARVKAKVTASNVTVAGELEGDVTCEDIFKITPTGQVEATVTASRLIVQEGGFYNGEFHMTKADETRVEPQRAAAAPVEDWRSYLPATEPQSPDDGETEEPD